MILKGNILKELFLIMSSNLLKYEKELYQNNITLIAGVDEADDAQGRDDAGQQDHDTKRGEQIGLEFHFVKHIDSPL